MKVNGGSLKPGYVIEHMGKIWRVVKTSHVKPGKGGAFCQAELKDLMVGTKLNERFRSEDAIERISLEQADYQFLFGDGDHFTFMHPTSFEQIALDKDDIGEDFVPFLQDGMAVAVESYEGKIIGVALPEYVTMEVKEAEAVVKGQTASSSYKPAILENGVRIMVPPYIGAGMRIVVNVYERSFVERAKD
ncbi:MAG: elongation factor P [Alphaproteobacteria bacterium]|nr:elongation factor P [Alphaproteobacteria bacterium]